MVSTKFRRKARSFSSLLARALSGAAASATFLLCSCSTARRALAKSSAGQWPKASCRCLRASWCLPVGEHQHRLHNPSHGEKGTEKTQRGRVQAASPHLKGLITLYPVPKGFQTSLEEHHPALSSIIQQYTHHLTFTSIHFYVDSDIVVSDSFS